MARKNMRRSEEIEKKLTYLRLNLDNIPEILTYTQKHEFKVSRLYNESKYRRYKYLDIKDIKIYLTSSNRNEELAEKCKNARSIDEYLNNVDQENILEHTKFLKMVEKLDIDNLKKVEKQQLELNAKMPFGVKYSENYLWQIYYFENIKEYVMFVSVEEFENAPFFHILKEQINPKSEKKVYVPIRNVEYTTTFLNKRNFEELENYFWLFTKEWPSIYEVFDKEGKMSIQIVGETNVYEKIRSQYKIKIESKEDAIRTYKLIKALYIIQTEAPNYFNFGTKINKRGGIDFYFDGRKIDYKVLAKFINREYILGKKQIKEAKKVIKTSMTRLVELEEIAAEQELEYLAKEKQISTFLECRKSFIGKVKYYFKYNKKQKVSVLETDIEDDEENEEDYELDSVKETMPARRKKQIIKEKAAAANEEQKVQLHTIDELIEIYKEFAEYEKNLKNIVMDINALKLKNKNTLKKIENATSFISQIDKHKKSIFEFWKYSNKDEVESLTEGEIEDVQIVKTHKRSFDYEEDFEKFGIDIDKIQRKVLTPRELDNIYITTTEVLEEVNRLKLSDVEPKEFEGAVKSLKRELSKLESSVDGEFDIFGGSIQEKVRISRLGNKKHREMPKNKFNILDLNKNASVLSFKLAIKQVIEDVEKALEKIQLRQDISAYKMIMNNELNTEEYCVVNIDQGAEVLENIQENSKDIVYNLYKFNMKKSTNIISFTNTIFYDNQNKTLPLGQNVSKKILIDLDMFNLKLIKEEDIKMLTNLENHAEIKEIKVFEYDVEFKTEKDVLEAVEKKKKGKS